MKYYKTSTEFNCGIDLHGREMYMCLVDREGNKLVHTNIPVSAMHPAMTSLRQTGSGLLSPRAGRCGPKSDFPSITLSIFQA